MDNRKRIKELLEKEKIFLSEEQYEKIDKYIELLLFYNSKFNLTAITDIDEIIIKHFIDSFLGKKYLENAKNIVDIGSGAGFPSLPLKIIYPEKRFLLLDSLNKRIGFLNEAIRELDIQNIETLHTRIEDAARIERYRGNFDVVLARAVAKLNTLVEYSIPLLKVGGKLVAYKSNSADEEIKNSENAMQKLFCKVEQNEKMMLSGEYCRNFVIIKKLKETPNVFPRRGNLPKKQPL